MVVSLCVQEVEVEDEHETPASWTSVVTGLAHLAHGLAGVLFVVCACKLVCFLLCVPPGSCVFSCACLCFNTRLQTSPVR